MDKDACSARYIMRYRSDIERWEVVDFGVGPEIIGIHVTDQDADPHARIDEESWAAYGQLAAG